MWDYVPYKSDMCSGAPEPLDNSSLMFVQPSNFSLQMGSQVKKALFYQYADATFTTRVVGLWSRFHLAWLSCKPSRCSKSSIGHLSCCKKYLEGNRIFGGNLLIALQGLKDLISRKFGPTSA